MRHNCRMLGRMLPGALLLAATPFAAAETQPTLTFLPAIPSTTAAASGATAEAAATLQDEADPWRFHFNSWLWLMGVEGDLTVRGNSADVSADFGDILDASDSIFAFSGHLEVGYGRWAGFLDGYYANLGVDDVSGSAGLVDIDVTMEQGILDFGVMFRVGEWAPSGAAANNVRDTTLDLYAGGRYSYLSLELDPANGPSRSGDRDWVDPIVGAKLVLPLAERWHLSANGDVGGFGVESDLTWSVSSVVGFDFKLFDIPATVYGGYRAIGWDYSDGSGANKFEWDIVNHGPMLGFGLRF